MNDTNTIGYTPATPDHLLIDAGAVYKNYGLPTEALISATSGGNEFDVVIKNRTVKVDGIKSDDIKGLKKFVSAAVTLKVNLLEITTEILQMSLMGDVDTTSNPDYNIITGRTSILDTDYIENVALVGELSGSGKPVVIIIKNVLNAEGLKVKTDDDKDNVLPLTLTAHTDPSTPNILPYEIHYPKVLNGLPFHLSNTPIIDNGKVLLTFSDTVAANVPLTGFAVTIAGVANVVTASARGVNALNTIELTLTTEPTSGQAVTVGYTKPELDANDVKSLSGVALATFSVIPVTNN